MLIVDVWWTFYLAHSKFLYLSNFLLVHFFFQPVLLALPINYVLVEKLAHEGTNYWMAAAGYGGDGFIEIQRPKVESYDELTSQVESMMVGCDVVTALNIS